jgi:hypothetical protein
MFAAIHRTSSRAFLPLDHPGWLNLAARGMSFNICRGTLGSMAMFTATRNASSRDSRPNRPPSCPVSES